MAEVENYLERQVAITILKVNLAFKQNTIGCRKTDLMLSISLLMIRKSDRWRHVRQLNRAVRTVKAGRRLSLKNKEELANKNRLN